MKKKPTNKPAGSVEVRIELALHARQQRVWDALVNDAGKWWPTSFYTSERTKRFVLEPRLGGRMFEDFGNGEGLVWFTVNGVESPNYLSLVGYMGPPFGGPAASILRIGLTAAGANETKLEIIDSLFGQVEGCETESGWRAIFDEYFRAHVESSASSRPAKRAARS
jgi:uncharacterized protein YndB with AHSA1/START domain